MKYNNIVQGEFIERPNRFIARVRIEEKEEIVHVKNTGRCKEILIPGAKVYLEKSNNPNRKTSYDLVAACKGNRIINIDSQLPNYLVEEWLKNQSLITDIKYVKREKTFGNSRFDFYIETEQRKIFMEVKGVTLENSNIVSFPDAPTSRGVKHVYELIKAKEQGYDAWIFFVVQMQQVDCFMPAWDKDPEFSGALKKAEENGVNIIAYDCLVDKDWVVINYPVSCIFDRT